MILDHTVRSVMSVRQCVLVNSFVPIVSEDDLDQPLDPAPARFRQRMPPRPAGRGGWTFTEPIAIRVTRA
jgi:hypothetical protein